MITSIRTGLGLATLVALLVAVPARAGQPESAATLISLDFPGGSARQYVDAIQRAAGELNIVIAPEADEVLMPPVSLKFVTPSAALDLLNDRVRASREREVRLHVKHLTAYDPRERPTYQVVATVSGRSNPTAAHVWTVAALLDNGLTSDAVLAAVEMAIEIVGSETDLDVRFHEDTALLIASGDEAQLDAIDEVIDRLHEVIERRREDPMRELERALEQVHAELGNAVDRLTEAEQGRKQARNEITGLRFELQRLEMESNDLRRILNGKERELERTSAQLHELQNELQRQRGRDIERQQPDS